MHFRKTLLMCLTTVIAAFALCHASYADDIIRVGVMGFKTRAEGINQHQADAITDEFTRMLTSSRSIAVIERERLDAIAREHRLNMSGLVDSRSAAELGKIAGLQYIITGSVTHFGTSKNIDTFIVAAELKENAEVTIDMRVIDVQTAEVALAMTETGTASNATSAFLLGKTGINSASVQDANLKELAISDAVARLGHRLKEAVVGEYPQVLSQGGNDIILSIGATSGVRAGNLYKISANGAEIHDMHGNVIGRRTTPIAVVKVSEVNNDFSVAHVVKNGGNASLVYRGDRVESVSQKEANDMAKKKVFPKNRPRKPLGESTLGGAELDSRLNTIAQDQKRQPENTVQQQQVHDDRQQAMNVGASFAGDNDISIRRSKSSKLENFSTDFGKVIASYGLSGDETNSLKEQHRQAEKMLSNEGKSDRYKGIFRQYPFDYLAAYKAAKLAFDIGHNSEAKEWAEKSLSVNPRYSPAKKLSKAASANM